MMTPAVAVLAALQDVSFTGPWSRLCKYMFPWGTKAFRAGLNVARTALLWYLQPDERESNLLYNSAFAIVGGLSMR